jgi:hypothetical protein
MFDTTSMRSQRDLDLPDLYDISGNTGGAENSTGFCTLMSSGANSTDGAEAAAGWTFSPAEGGFRTSTGVETSLHFNAYVGENRGYRGYGTSLRTSYNFGFLDSRPNWLSFSANLIAKVSSSCLSCLLSCCWSAGFSRLWL